MGWITKYDIEFQGLKEGLHEFEYDIENKFFEWFEQELVSVGSLNATVKLEKRSTFLKLLFNIKGWVELTCDRCLEIYKQAVAHNEEIFVKFSETYARDDDNIIWVLPEEHRINVAQLIFEFIIVSIPLRHVHPLNENGERDCNKEMIKKLEEYTRPVDTKTETDPRWKVLKTIKIGN